MNKYSSDSELKLFIISVLEEVIIRNIYNSNNLIQIKGSYRLQIPFPRSKESLMRSYLQFNNLLSKKINK